VKVFADELRGFLHFMDGAVLRYALSFAFYFSTFLTCYCGLSGKSTAALSLVVFSANEILGPAAKLQPSAAVSEASLNPCLLNTAMLMAFKVLALFDLLVAFYGESFSEPQKS
jgi:hypothetical protein